MAFDFDWMREEAEPGVHEMLITTAFWGLLVLSFAYLVVESQTFPENMKWMSSLALYLIVIGALFLYALGGIEFFYVADYVDEFMAAAASSLTQIITTAIAALGALFSTIQSYFANPVDSLSFFTAQALGEDLVFSGFLTLANLAIIALIRGLEPDELGPLDVLMALVMTGYEFAAFHGWAYLHIPIYQAFIKALWPPPFLPISPFFSPFVTQIIKSYFVIRTGDVVGVGLGHVFTNWILSGAGLSVILATFSGINPLWLIAAIIAILVLFKLKEVF